MDLTASVVDEGYAGTDQLVYSYGACGISSSYAKFRRAALMNASQIVQIVETYVKDERDYIEQQFAVILETEGMASCSFTESCPCANCQAGTGGWRSTTDPSQYYSIVLNRMTVTHTGNIDVNSEAARHTQCLSRLVEARLKRIMLREYEDPTRMGWLMWGDQESASWLGLPGIDWCAGDYDPRFRPWYVSAVSGPKDVVIVLDRSNSMIEESSPGVTRWSLAVSAAIAVLDTLSEFDFTTIVIFHSGSEVFEGRTEQLLQATPENVERMRTWLRDLHPLGSTDFRSAFTTAFNLIRFSAASSNCNGMVLFLTDGIDRSDMDANEVAQMNTRNYTVFTYSFGSDADTAKPKQIACRNHGIWYHVTDGADLKNAMANYYQYYAEGMATEQQIRWTMYEEWTTRNRMITGCLPAFNRSGSHPELLGVFCMDVSLIIPVVEFEQKPDYQQSWTTMRSQASRCFPTAHSNSTLERFRGAVSRESRCETGAVDSARGCVPGPLAVLWLLMPLALCAALHRVGV
jgi:hypothetical protein